MCGPSRFRKFNRYPAQSRRNEVKRVKQPASGMTAIIVLSLFAGGSSPAQQSPHERHSQAGSVPLEILQRPVTLRTGIGELHEDRKSTRLNSSHSQISYAVFCLKKKTIYSRRTLHTLSCAA